MYMIKKKFYVCLRTTRIQLDSGEFRHPQRSELVIKMLSLVPQRIADGQLEKNINPWCFFLRGIEDRMLMAFSGISFDLGCLSSSVFPTAKLCMRCSILGRQRRFALRKTAVIWYWKSKKGTKSLGLQNASVDAVALTEWKKQFAQEKLSPYALCCYQKTSCWAQTEPSPGGRLGYYTAKRSLASIAFRVSQR